MREVALASLAVGTPMGQQEYETQLERHLADVATEFTIRTVRVRSLRSALDGDARLPLSVLGRAPQTVQNLAARYGYGRTDLVHRMDLRLPAGRNEVVTVHDLAPLRFTDEGEIPGRARDSLLRARSVICPSRFAAGELASLLDVSTTTVIPNGLDPRVWTEIPDGHAILDQLGLGARLILHSGGATERKNLAGLAAAWRSLAKEFPDVELALCGPPDVRRNAAFDGLPRVRMLGRLARPAHLALMSAAEVVVVPSTYEGFGFPALEAMARGTAVVAVDGTAVAEVCGAAAVLSEPDGSSLSAAVGALLADLEKRERLAAGGIAQARRFTWESSARLHAAIYADCVAT